METRGPRTLETWAASTLVFLLLQATAQGQPAGPIPGGASTTPPAFLYRCQTKDYVNVLYTCDGVIDCNDGSDERDCSLVVERDRIKCDGGGAITSVWNSCDGFQDCADNSDEDKCVLPTCVEGTLECKTWFNARVCLKPGRQCDSEINCLWGEDERINNCSYADGLTDEINQGQRCIKFKSSTSQKECGKCEEGQYHCRGSSTCVPVTSLCDGSRDCLRGDDEKFCNRVLSPECAGTVNGRRDWALNCTDNLTPSKTSVTSETYHNPRILLLDRMGIKGLSVFTKLKTRMSGRYIAVLSLEDNSLVTISPAGFKRFPNLRKLYLRGNPIRSDLGFQFLYNLKLLQYLGMEKTVDSDFPFALVSYVDLYSNRTSRLRVDIDLPYEACCRLWKDVDSNCLGNAVAFRTCEQLLPESATNALWGILAVGIILNMVYIVTESKHRADDEFRFMSVLTIFMANLTTLVSCAGLAFESTITRGRYYNHDKSWQQSYTCWLVSTFWSIGYFLYFLALIIQVCQVFAQRYLSVDSYYKIISSRLFAFYVFVIVVISLIPIVLPLSSFNTLKVYVTYIGPICNPFMDLISEKMITPGKTYAAVVFIGAPAAALGMNMLFGLVYLVKVCRRLRTPLPDPAPRKTRWSSVATVVVGQVYGLIMGPIAALLYWDVVTMETDTVRYLSLILLPTFILVSPGPFLVSTFLKSQLFKDISDQLQKNRKSTLRRTGGFNRRASRNFQKLSTYLETGGKVTPAEALLMTTKMAYMISNFHDEGMVCDDISTDYVVIGVDQKNRILDHNLVVTTEYPKCDVDEWRRQRDVAALGEVVRCMINQLQPAKQKRMTKKRVSFKTQGAFSITP